MNEVKYLIIVLCVNCNRGILLYGPGKVPKLVWTNSSALCSHH